MYFDLTEQLKTVGLNFLYINRKFSYTFTVFCLQYFQEKKYLLQHSVISFFFLISQKTSIKNFWCWIIFLLFFWRGKQFLRVLPINRVLFLLLTVQFFLNYFYVFSYNLVCFEDLFYIVIFFVVYFLYFQIICKINYSV